MRRHALAQQGESVEHVGVIADLLPDGSGAHRGRPRLRRRLDLVRDAARARDTEVAALDRSIEESTDTRADLAARLGIEHRARGGEPDLVIPGAIDRAGAAVEAETSPEPALVVEGVAEEDRLGEAAPAAVTEGVARFGERLDHPGLPDHAVRGVLRRVRPAEKRAPARAVRGIGERLPGAERGLAEAGLSARPPGRGQGDEPVRRVPHGRLRVTVRAVPSGREGAVRPLPGERRARGADDDLGEPHGRTPARARPGRPARRARSEPVANRSDADAEDMGGSAVSDERPGSKRQGVSPGAARRRRTRRPRESPAPDAPPPSGPTARAA